MGAQLVVDSLSDYKIGVMCFCATENCTIVKVRDSKLTKLYVLWCSKKIKNWIKIIGSQLR
jgi:hypothetical protein